MGSDNRFAPTAPAPLGAAAAGTELAASPAARERVDYAVAGVIGLQLSEPLADMQRIVHDLISTGKISRAQVQELSGAIETARRVAMQSQQLARLARGRLRQSHERLSLDAVVKQTLAERSQFFHQRGIELSQRIKRVEVIVDPGLLSGLIEAAVDWICDRGHRLAVSLEVKNWPEHAILVFKAVRSVYGGEQDAAVDPEFEKLSWHLLAETAQSLGVALDRVRSVEETVLMIEFPRTVKQLESLAAVDADGGVDSWMPSEAKSLAGHEVLLVTAEQALADEIAGICGNMGLVVAQAATSEAAVQHCQRERPHLIVIDERLRDAAFDEFWKTLLQQNPDFPSIEVASDANTLAMASWMRDSVTRVTRSSLRAQLPQALVLELGKLG